MGVTKKIARNIVLPFALSLKADQYFLRKSNKSCCIINFHGVRKNNNEIFNNRHIPSTEFEKIIQYLKNNFDIVSLSEIFDIHREKRKVKRKTVALTFDDGYLNNFEIALPILKKYHVPATFYIISKGLTNSNFIVWPDGIDLVKKFKKTHVDVQGLKFEFPNYYNEEKKSELINYLKTTGEKAEELSQPFFKDVVETKMNELNELLRLIDEKTIQKYINEPLIEFGSHTHTHFCLEYLKKETAHLELEHSKELIEKITNRNVDSLAFPDGSYNNETLSLAENLGYKNLVAVDYKFNENNQNPNLLSRFTISNSTTFESNALRLAREFGKYGFN